MISFYKWKKHAVFVMLGVIPLMIFLLIFFPTIKFFNYEGLRFMYLDYTMVAVSIAIAFIVAVVIIFVGSRWLRHAFTDMLEGKGLLTFILDSTGVLGSFNTRVMTPKMQGVFPQKGMAPVEDIYDSDLLYRLMVPKDAGFSKAVSFSKDEEGKIVLGEEVDVLVLPKADESSKVLFRFENRPVLIFNKAMNKYLSRDALAKYEKDIEIKHNALNILRKVQETDISFRNFGRYIGENIKPMKRGIFGSPLMKWVIYGAIIALIVFIILLFVPGFLSAGSNLNFP